MLRFHISMEISDFLEEINHKNSWYSLKKMVSCCKLKPVIYYESLKCMCAFYSHLLTLL